MSLPAETKNEARRAKSCDLVDNLSPGLRECVHEFGFAIVTACMTQGVKTPHGIRHLVNAIWAGARQPEQRSGAAQTLDWMLIQAGAGISAATLRRVLAGYSLHIVPDSPTREMLAASMAEVSAFSERMTKEEKHRRRLRAAIRAFTQTELAKRGSA